MAKKTKKKAEVSLDVKVPAIAKPKKRSDHAAKVVEGIRKAFKSEYAASTLAEATGNGKHDFRRTGWLRTGLWAIDFLLGDMNGIPLGVAGTVCGDENVGKSSLIQFFMKCVQEADGTNVYYDYDGDLQPKRLLGYGIDLGRVVVPDVVTIEEGFDSLGQAFASVYGDVQSTRKRKEAAKRVNVPMMAVFDSIAAANTKRRRDAKSAEDSVVGRKAAVLSEQNENLRLYLRGRPATVIFINELREDIGGTNRFGKVLKMPGGRSLRYMSRWMLKLSRGQKIRRNKDDRVVAFEVYAHTLKSSYGQVFATQRFILSTVKGEEGGPHPVRSNYLFLKDNGLLIAKGKKGDIIRGLKEEVGIFHKTEWPDVMREHEDKIVEIIKAHTVSAAVGDESAEIEDTDD